MDEAKLSCDREPNIVRPYNEMEILLKGSDDAVNKAITEGYEFLMRFESIDICERMIQDSTFIQVNWHMVFVL